MMQYLFIICVTVFVLNFSTKGDAAPEVSINYYVKTINSRQTSWRAGKFYKTNVTKKSLTRSTTKLTFAHDHTHNIKVKECNLEGVKIPESFDARLHWPECIDVISKIKSQGHCNGCWAFAATSVMADRLCIQSGGKVKIEISPQDAMSCCKNCSKGCGGLGYPWKLWDFYIHSGLVSGGGYSSYQGCKPYQESEFLFNISSPCTEVCDNPNYGIPYHEDKHFGSEYYLVENSPECIQAEIMKNGPVQVLFGLYEDFAFYKDGVYFHTIGQRTTVHSVRVLGWGVENGTPYWLAANSWGSIWGNLNGFFKIRRGYDECAIEQYVIAGNPRLEQYVTTKKPRLDSRSGSVSINKSEKSGSGVWIVVSLAFVAVVLIAIMGGFIYKESIKNTVTKYWRFW